MSAASNPTAFHILLLGDFSGRANRGTSETGASLASRRPRLLDRDNLEELMQRWDVQLTRTVVASDRGPITVSFRELDDFHPDQLFERVELFSELRSLRRRLLDPSQFPDAAEEVLAWGSGAAETVTDADTDAAETGSSHSGEAEQSPSNLLDRMLMEAQEADNLGVSPEELEWQQLIQDIVAPVMPDRIDPRQDDLVDCVDRATETLMTALLHHPHFQQLEANWRGLDLLVRRLETDVELKLFVLDVSKAELAADLLGGRELAETGLYRLLVEQTQQTPGAVPWSIIAGLYSFAASENDMQLLEQLAQLSRMAKAPFMAAADRSFVGCADAEGMLEPDRWTDMDERLKSTWDAVRATPEANQVGLLWPRFLLRLPYGAATRPIDSFRLEEVTGSVRHEQLLWGNPVVLAAASIGESFSEFGWDARLAQGREFAGMPVLTERVEGETILHPCGEFILTERTVEHLQRRGITPVLSVQGRDAIQLPWRRAINGSLLVGC